MAILSFGFNKIAVERKGPIKGKLSINHNAKINDVKSAEVKLGTSKQPSIRVSFEYTATYDPGVAQIQLAGELVWVDVQANIDKIMQEWEKTKKLPKETMVPIYNRVLQRSVMQALSLSKELNLPPPIKLPRLNPENVK
jgi:hypothetical protein